MVLVMVLETVPAMDGRSNLQKLLPTKVVWQ